MSISENQVQRLNRSMPIAKDTSLGNIIKGLEEKVALIPKKVDKQPDSTATDVAGVVKDLNALIAKLKAAGVMTP